MLLCFIFSDRQHASASDDLDDIPIIRSIASSSTDTKLSRKKVDADYCIEYFLHARPI